MRRWGYSAALTAILLTAPAAGQDAPKSLLPDVFGAPRPEAAPSPTPPPPPPPPPNETAPGGETQPPPVAAPSAIGPDPLASAPTLARSLDIVGPLTVRIGGYGGRAFAGSDGRFVTRIVELIKPPVGSRWAHIVLRRAMLSRVPTPAGVRPADWVAARALLLLRMGEVDGAKLLVEALPLDRYTPRLYAVAGQVHLAASDIPALCPLAPSARGFSKAPLWDAANAICAGIDGDDIAAATQFDKLRARRDLPAIDITLAERVATVTTGEGRGSNVEWEDTARLGAYRFGLATAAGIELPETLVAAPPVALTGWLMRAPGIDVDVRAGIAPRAAAYGIASASELAAIAALQVADSDNEAAADMRTAFSGRTSDERIAAMQRIWMLGKTPLDRYGRLVQTAAAAARIPPAAAQADEAAALIRSMLSAGYARAALAWWPVLQTATEADRLAAWPLLALADARGTVAADAGIARDWHRGLRGDGDASARKAAMFGAAMRGLGRPGWDGFANSFDVERPDDNFSRRLIAATNARRRGEVAVLAAAGLQPGWARVAPGRFEIIVAALNTVGLRAEARMLAVEALTRN